MDTKLRIKMGSVEVDYEGSDEFLKKELPELLKAVLELHASAADNVDGEKNVADAPSKRKKVSEVRALSVSTVAAKIGAKKGGDLALAAAAALVLGEGKESFSRSDLLRAMQSARAYYKTSFSSNLSNYIARLVKSQALLDHGGDNFGLQAGKRKELEERLA